MKSATRRMVNKLKPAQTLMKVSSFGILKFPAKKFISLPKGFRKTTPRIYGQIGDLQVCLAQTRQEIRKAQELRYQVFYEEMSAIADAEKMMKKRDEDPYDPICDHLLVIDTSLDAGKKRFWPGRSSNSATNVIGTYRMLRQEVAELYDGFYTQGEYDIASLIEAKRSLNYSFVELGRSCVLKPYRNKRSVELLWQGIWTYVREHRSDVMIGCASFAGTDPRQHAMALSFLHHHARAPEEWRVRAHDHLFVDMNMIPAEELDMKSALKALPPLIKGYLRLGAYIGDGAVVDHQFGTTDVLIVLPVEALDARYFTHFGTPDDVESSRSNRTKLMS